MSKGSNRRKGKGYDNNYDDVFSKPTDLLEQQLEDEIERVKVQRDTPRTPLEEKRDRFKRAHGIKE